MPLNGNDRHRTTRPVAGNFRRFKLDRLQAVSSRNMYSEQGLDALMRPEFGQVCHLLIVVSYWTPGSPQAQAPSDIWDRIYLASYSGAELGAVGHPTRLPLLPFIHRSHELIAQPNRQIGVLEHDRRIGFAVEVGVIFAAVNQHPSLLLFSVFALNEVQNIGMPVFERLHLGGATCLPARFHHGGNLIVDSA